MVLGYVFWISNHFLWSFCIFLFAFDVLHPVSYRKKNMDIILQHPFMRNFSMKKMSQKNIPHPATGHHLGRSPLMAWQPLQQPCLQPTPRFFQQVFSHDYRSNMLNSRGFLEENVWKRSPSFWFFKGHRNRGWFQQRNCGFTKATLMWSSPNMVGDAQMRPTSSRLRSPEVPSCDWGYGCFDSSGKACMKLSEKVQTTYSYTQIQKCTYQSYELWVSDWCLAHEFWRSPAFLAFLKSPRLELKVQRIANTVWQTRWGQMRKGCQVGKLGKHGAYHCCYCRWLASRGRKMRRTSNLVALWGLAFWQHSCITKSHLGHLRVDLPPCLTHFSVPLEFRMLLSEMICWADLIWAGYYLRATQNTEQSQKHAQMILELLGWSKFSHQVTRFKSFQSRTDRLPIREVQGRRGARRYLDIDTVYDGSWLKGKELRLERSKRGIDCRCQKPRWNVGFTPERARKYQPFKTCFKML